MVRYALTLVPLLLLASAALPDEPATREILYRGEATSILGRPVTGANGKKIGLVIDVLVDETGQPRAAVLDFGGFLGIGNRHVAVAWRALHFSPRDPSGAISVDLTEDEIRTVPEYKPAATKPVTMAAPPQPPQAVEDTKR